MRKSLIFIFLLASNTLMAQNLENVWKEIDSEFNEGNFKSVLPKVENAATIARKQSNYPQLIKALFYEAKINIATSDETDDVSRVFEKFKKEIQASSDVEKLVFQAYLVKLYQIYYDENRWLIRNRTDLQSTASEDVRFWTEADFEKKITGLYKEILAQKSLLQNAKSSDWKDIFVYAKDDFNQQLLLTPTLYDAFIHYYIEYLGQKGGETQNELAELAQANFVKKELNAYLFNESLRIKSKPEADYLVQLEKLADTYPKEWYSGEIFKSLAQEYFQKGEDSFALQMLFSLDKKVRALGLDKDVIAVYKSTIEAIKTPHLRVEIERYILPNSNTPLYIEHKNLERVYVKILDYNIGLNDINLFEVQNAFNSQNKDAEQRFNQFLTKHKTIKEYSIPVKVFTDYKSHSSIFNFLPLPKGRYIALFSPSPDFKFNPKEILQYAEVFVSDKAIESDGSEELFVRERQSGKPVSKAKIEVYNYSFDYRAQKENYKSVETINADKFGNAKLKDGRQLVYRLAGEQVFYGQNLYRYNRFLRSNIEEQTSTKIFTDRAIYRPGQTVYFKAIVMLAKDKEIRVLPKKEVEVSLSDVNGKEVQKLKLVTNEFGSVHGEFALPSSALTGHFSIQTNQNGYQGILVEEYKRPKFSVEFKKPEEAYKLNDTVKVSGIALAFSGATIGNAPVKYRVTRQAISAWWKSIYTPAEQIATGTTITNNKGEFVIDFVAVPGADKMGLQLYFYTIESSVTDISGETQTGEVIIKVGNQKVVFSTSIKEKTSPDKLASFQVKAVNLNDKVLNQKGQISITEMLASDRVLRPSNYYSNYNFYSEKEYVKLFPNMPYGNENNPERMKKGSTVFSSNFDTADSTSLSVPDTKTLKEGYYLISMKAEGDTATQTQMIYLVNPKSESKELFSYRLNKEKYAPGETAELYLKSATDKLYVNLKIEADGKAIREEIVQLKGKERKLEIPILESYKGGIFVHYMFTKYNTIEKGTIGVKVPFEHKKLEITSSVNRDKLIPGAKEKWSFKVLGQDKALAEMLTGMYDASLDQFAENSFQYFAYNFSNYAQLGFGYQKFAFTQAAVLDANYINNYPDFGKLWTYFPLNTYELGFNNRYYRRGRMMMKEMAVDMAAASVEMVNEEAANLQGGEVAQEKFIPPTVVDSAVTSKKSLENIQARKILEETAFFYPNLVTDKEGNVSFEFTVPESLTEWKLMAFAHTPDMKTGYYETRLKTQKDLMVVPNLPRFLREDDEIKISSKIVNLSEHAIQGQARLILSDPISGRAVEGIITDTNATKNFSIENGNSGEVSWWLKVPSGIEAINIKVVAAAGNFQDGEETVLAVVTNRILVTETLPVYIKENQSKNFTLAGIASNKSKTLENYKLTLEMTSNPLWYAIFALPYLRESNYECSEQAFSRLYGNLISEQLINSQPKIKAVFDDWRAKGQLKSRLELNQELKNVLLEESPWLRNAENEEEQMKRIAVLFDLNQMSNELQAAFFKLQQMQLQSGGFPWFDGGRENEFITTYIVSSYGNLKQMNVDFKRFNLEYGNMLSKAITFIDQMQISQLKKKKPIEDYDLGMHYLYARSFFVNEYPLPQELDSLKTSYLTKIKKEKFNLGLQTQAMAAFVLHRFGETAEAKKLLNAIKERSVSSDEMGMYWMNNQPGWFWYNAPIETQSLLIQAFDEILKDESSVEEMKVWLLKNRQTNQWNSTKATTSAVNALLNTGKNWVNADSGVDLKLGNENIALNQEQSGTGYSKIIWNKEQILPEMANVQISKETPGVAWGALYWQYFEDLDQIKSAETGISFNKKLYKKETNEKGFILKDISEITPLQVGDLVTVRLEISIDRDMQFVHIKDMRGSGFEPVNVLSGYRWKDGFGYYESTRDVASHFFADFMSKGTYVFEYDLRANNAGDFSNGITQMQNMYAPEMSAKSEGMRMRIN